jgi:alpha-ketoglutaric semialdehyde dehydrogenase
VKPLLLLIDLQRDFLAAPGLEPPAGRIVEGAAALLERARAAGIPVVHAWTTVERSLDRRMPHWKTSDRWICVRGTEGHAPPARLLPRRGESVVEKTFFSPFSVAELDRIIAASGCDTLLLAGIHLHGCLRAAALDAYARGLEVRIAEDAVGSDDPLHAAVTQRYLEARGLRFCPGAALLADCAPGGAATGSAIEHLPEAVISGRPIGSGPVEIVHNCPDGPETPLFGFATAEGSTVGEAVDAARRAFDGWRGIPFDARGQTLTRLADMLDSEAPALALQMAVEIGKPVTLGAAEVRRAAALLRAASAAPPPPVATATGETVRRRPLGVLAVVTPWNNPIAIPLGKIGPALLFGNTVVWKAAPAASRVALAVLRLIHRAGVPESAVNLVLGDRRAAARLMGAAGIGGVTVSGSSMLGWAAQEICARRRIPLQAELGGNNGAIVWSDADRDEAAREIARGAFGFAGQRCTANRRAVIEARIFEDLSAKLERAARELAWGDPLDAATSIGPLISRGSRDRVAAELARARLGGMPVVFPHAGSPDYETLPRRGAYCAPALVIARDPGSEIVSEETFGPVLVLQPARDFDEALGLLNGVRQGLTAALFSTSEDLKQKFLDQACAGILKINRSTADAGVTAPFGGWKASGLGPPEHGAGNVEFDTRVQTLYGAGR